VAARIAAVAGMSTERRLVFFYELTDEGARSFVRPGDTVACLVGAGSAVATAGARRLGLLAFPQEGGLVEHDRLLELTRSVRTIFESESELAPWLVELYGNDAPRHYLAKVIFREVDWLVAAAAVVQRDLPGHDVVELTPDWPASISWPVVLEAMQGPLLRPRLHELLGNDLAATLLRLRAVGRPPARRALPRRLLTALLVVALTWLKVLRFARLRAVALPRSRVVLRTYGTDWEDSPDVARRLRRVDFLVDGDELRKDDVVVWAEPHVTEARKQALRERGYTVVEREALRFGLGAVVRRVIPGLLAFTARLPALVRSNGWWQFHAASLVRDRHVWDETARALGTTTFVAYNDISGWAVPRNAMFARNGIRTVFYQHSSGSYSEVDGEWRESFACADLNFTAFAGWGPVHLDLYRRSGSAFDEYWDVGCLWSEQSRLIAEDAELHRVYAEQLGAPLDDYGRVVAVIDATITSEIARRAWLGTHEAALEAALAMPDVLFLVKPKFGLEEILAKTGQEGRDLIGRLDEAANVVLVPAAYETSAVVAFSNCVVGMPFTSVVIEAIGAGKPGVYIDPVEQFPGHSWSRVPGMLVTDAAGLERRLRELLASTPEQNLAYLRGHLSHVEGHFDGRAITRLRRRILEAR
jgi:polysaccharide biosynthesis PFTS motif protein